MRATAQSVNDDWLTVMSYDLRVWPLTDVLVFALIPIRFRVAFVSTVSTCWQTYLSYTASQGTAPGGGALRRTLSGNCRVL